MIPEIIILDGPVGSGKGTQANLLATKFNYYQFGFGTELRNFVANYGNSLDSDHYELALKIKNIMQQGENVEPNDLFKICGDKITNLIESGQKIVIDSVKTFGAFEWLATLTKENNLETTLIEFILPIEFSLKRLESRFYVPSLPDIPFNSFEDAKKNCAENEEPYRRDDDLNKNRIYRQYELYTKNKLEAHKILVENGVKVFQIDASSKIEEIFDKIQTTLQLVTVVK